MDSSPIANRTRARANTDQQDASNRDGMSDRDLNHTPDPIGSEIDQENDSVGQPGHSPNEFEGFDPNDIENVNISNLYRAFMENNQSFGDQSPPDASHNPGQMPYTHTSQSFPYASRNPGHMPYTHTSQSFPDASPILGHMPYTHIDQGFPNTNYNLGQVPNAHPNHYNFNTPVDNSGRGKIDKSTTERNQFLTQKKVLDHIKNIVDSKLLEVNHILEDEEILTESVTMELLEDHGAWLESQKTFTSKKSSIVAHIMSTLHPTSPVFDNFLDLEQEFNTIEKQIITAVNRIKKRTTQFNKDKEISRKERIGLPKFKGDFLEFNRYRTSFTNFCKGLGEEDKKQHLINSLEAEPLSVVEPLVNADQPFQVVWDALVEHFANPKEILDSAVSRYLNTPTPCNKMNDLNKHFIDMRNFAANIIRLNLTQEQLLVQIYLLKIPGDFRADLENHLPKDQNKYLFKDIAPCVNKNIRAKKYSYSPDTQVNSYPPTASITATPGVIVQSGTPTQGGSGSGHNGKHKPKQCHICGKVGHTMGFCRTYKKGPEMRKMLQQLSRCDQCLQLSKDHLNKCRTLSSPCKTCGDSTHFSITCDGNQHPGSWITKMCNPNNSQTNSNTKTVTQTANTH